MADVGSKRPMMLTKTSSGSSGLSALRKVDFGFAARDARMGVSMAGKA